MYLYFDNYFSKLQRSFRKEFNAQPFFTITIEKWYKSFPGPGEADTLLTDL